MTLILSDKLRQLGANPLMALNIVASPEDRLDDLGIILKGGAEKVAETGALLVGGHTIKDKKPSTCFSRLHLLKKKSKK